MAANMHSKTSDNIIESNTGRRIDNRNSSSHSNNNNDSNNNSTSNNKSNNNKSNNNKSKNNNNNNNNNNHNTTDTPRSYGSAAEADTFTSARAKHVFLVLVCLASELDIPGASYSEEANEQLQPQQLRRKMLAPRILQCQVSAISMCNQKYFMIPQGTAAFFCLFLSGPRETFEAVNAVSAAVDAGPVELDFFVTILFAQTAN